MSHLAFEQIADSRDTFRAYITETYVDAETGEEVSAALDLTLYTVELVGWKKGSSGYAAAEDLKKSMIKEDQINSKGYAFYQLVSGDLTAGTWKFRVKLTDGSSKPFWTDELEGIVVAP